MEEYKETLKCTVEYGVTQESLINLWQILLKLETVRPYWQDMLANATWYLSLILCFCVAY